MTGRTAHAINRADVCILVIDASTGVTMQDKKIAGLIQEAHAPCMIVVNKWDLARELGEFGVWVRLQYVYPYPHVDEIIDLMAQGKVLAEGSPDAVRANPAVIEAYLGH